MKYRKKPVVVEAIQATGENNAEIIEWTKGSRTPARMDYSVTVMGDGSRLVDSVPGLCIRSDDIAWPIAPGDWVIRGSEGFVSYCKPDIFEQTYEPVED